MSNGKELTGKQKLSLRKRKAFLKVLAQTGRIKQAARRAGFADTSYLHRMYNEDEEFARQWDQALEAAGDVLEDEAVRRATEGVKKPVFYKGEVVGHETQYSDQLLMFLMKGARPGKYRDSQQGQGQKQVSDNVFVLPMMVPDANQWQQQANRVVQGNGQQEGVRVIDAEAQETTPSGQDGRQIERKG